MLSGYQHAQRKVKAGVHDELKTEIVRGLDEKDELIIADGKDEPTIEDGVPNIF